MTASTFGPVRYYHGQNLDVGAFVDEQRYHVAMQRRHNVGPHRWGIVSGLQLRIADPTSSGSDAPSVLQVLPGFAVDGYGRELVLSEIEDIDLDLAAQRRNGVAVLDVWLAYRLREAGAADDDSTARWNETPEVFVQPAASAATIRGTATFAPEEPQPWGDGSPWPVPLGSIHLGTGGADKATIDPAGRQFAGLVGQEVRPPAGRGRLSFGAAGEAHRFAVRIEPAPGEAQTPTDGPPGAVLWIDSQNRLRAGAPVEFGGDLTLGGGDVRFSAPAAPGAPGASAADGPDTEGWRVYRYHDSESGEEELRIEMPAVAAATDGAAPGEVVVGAWSAAEKTFKPALTVAADGTVTVAGDLTVDGLINPQETSADKSAANEQVQAAKLAALSAAASAKNAEKIVEQLEKQQRGLAAWLAGLLKKALGLLGIGPRAPGR